MGFIKNVCSLPLHQLLSDNGYKIDKDSYSRNNPSFKDEVIGGNIVVSKKIKEGNEIYLYFNTFHQWDRGNIINFCANRNLKIQDFIEHKGMGNAQPKLQDIGVITPQKIQESVKEFKQFQPYCLQEDLLLQNRGIYSSTIQSFLKSAKQDQFGNLCIPTYQLESLSDNANTQIITQCGFIRRLKIPLYKDADGAMRKKPLKSISKGRKGMEILLPETSKEEKLKNVKYIIITESIIDTLSLIQLKGLKPQEVIATSTAGNFEKESVSNLLSELILQVQKFQQQDTALSIYIAMDNDEKGREYSKILENTILQRFNKMAIIYTPFAKDVNDDLKISQIIKNNRVDFASVNQFCQSKINEYKATSQTDKRRNILEDLRQIDRLKSLPQNIKDKFNSISKHRAIKNL